MKHSQNDFGSQSFLRLGLCQASCKEPIYVFFQLFVYIFKKSPLTSDFYENAATLFCCEATEMFYRWGNFTWLSTTLHFHFWVSCFFKLEDLLPFYSMSLKTEYLLRFCWTKQEFEDILDSGKLWWASLHSFSEWLIYSLEKSARWTSEVTIISLR